MCSCIEYYVLCTLFTYWSTLFWNNFCLFVLYNLFLSVLWILNIFSHLFGLIENILGDKRQAINRIKSESSKPKLLFRRSGERFLLDNARVSLHSWWKYQNLVFLFDTSFVTQNGIFWKLRTTEFIQDEVFHNLQSANVFFWSRKRNVFLSLEDVNNLKMSLWYFCYPNFKIFTMLT